MNRSALPSVSTMTMLALVTYSHVVALDVGGTKLQAARISSEGEIGARLEIPSPKESKESLLAGMEQIVGDLIDKETGAIGVGVPGKIDHEAGVVTVAANLPLASAPVRKHLSERFGLPVYLENDANAAAIGEWKVGAGRGSERMAMLVIGTGFGSGVILDGMLYRDQTGADAEIGHTVIVKEGKLCACGGKGHVEAYVSGSAATTLAREAFGKDSDSRKLMALARAGNEKAIAILAEMGDHLGCALATAVNVFEVDLLVIGGGFSVAWDFFFEQAGERMRKEVVSADPDAIRVAKAELGDHAGIIGAGLGAYDLIEHAPA